MEKKISISLVFTFFLVFCTGAFAQEKKQNEPVKTQFDVAATIGAWLPGQIDIEGHEVDKDMGLLLRGFVDAFLMPNFAVGGYINYFTGTLSEGGESMDVWFYEFGMALKPKFVINEKMFFKPGLNIGYRLNDRESFYSGDNTKSDGFGLNLSAEIGYIVSPAYTLILDIGFLSQPAGGNEDANVTWAPIVYVNIGVLF